MHTIGDLRIVPVWVNPEHLVESARLLLVGHRLRAVGVVDQGRLVGILTRERAELAVEGSTVAESMRPVELSLAPDTLTPQAAKTFIDHDLDVLPVVADGRFLGMVTATMLLRELRRSWDPLTGLGWSDRLREWGMDQLKLGHEISILFIDLNDFGAYNKQFGHIVGDRVLRRVAELLKSVVNDETDILVRYGGDEFVIGTLRNQNEALELARTLRAEATALFIDDLTKPVSFAVGISGGRRSRERENVHFAATFDELVNAASKQCLAQKRKPESVPVAAAPEPEPTLQPEPAPQPEPEAPPVPRTPWDIETPSPSG